MEIGAIFLILALAVVVGLFVGRPFINSVNSGAVTEQPDADQLAHHRSTMLAERDRLLNALQELDFDHGLGKIPAEDYQPQRALLLQRAANALRELDAMGEDSPQVSPEDRVERAVAARRADGVVKPSSAAVPAAVALGGNGIGQEDDLEKLILSRRTQRHEKSGGFCPKCGRPVLKSDKFCSNCGAVVS